MSRAQHKSRATESEQSIGRLFREIGPYGRGFLGEVTLVELLRAIPLEAGSVMVVDPVNGSLLGRLRVRAIRHLLAENACRERVSGAQVEAALDLVELRGAGSDESAAAAESRLVLALWK